MTANIEDDLLNIPIASFGVITLSAALSPTGKETLFAYELYGSEKYRTLICSVCGTGSATYKRVYNKDANKWHPWESYVKNTDLGAVKTDIDLDDFWDFYIGTATNVVNAPVNGVLYIINIPGNSAGRAYQQIMSVGGTPISLMYRNAFRGVWREWERSVANSDCGEIISGNLAANTITTIPIIFKNAFPSTPFVLAYMQNSSTDSNNYYWVIDIPNISRTGCNVRIKNTLIQDTALNSSRYLKWIAMVK